MNTQTTYVLTPHPWPDSYIRSLADEATVLAKQKDLRPTPAKQAIANWKKSKHFHIPFLGDYVPQEWKQVREIEPFFVDRTGQAQSGVSNAITVCEFYCKIEEWVKQDKPFAFGVIELNQTKVLVAVYRKE